MKTKKMITNKTTVKRAIETTCIKRQPALRDPVLTPS